MDDPHGVFRSWAVRAHLLRVDQETGGPRWSLVLLPAPDDSEHALEAVGPADPSVIYGQPDEAFRAYYRELLETVYRVIDVPEPDEWALLPKLG